MEIRKEYLKKVFYFGLNYLFYQIKEYKKQNSLKFISQKEIKKYVQPQLQHMLQNIVSNNVITLKKKLNNKTNVFTLSNNLTLPDYQHIFL